MSRAAIQSLLQTSQRLHQAGRLAEAESGYRQVLQRSPDEPNALHLLGLIAHQTGRTDAAVELLRKSVSGKRTPPEFHFNLGGVLLAAGDPQGAVQHYTRAIELRSGYAEAHNGLCAALCRLERFDEAVAAGERAAGYARDSAEAKRPLARALFLLGSARDRQGRPRDAVVAYGRYTQLAPDDPSGFVNLAVNLAQTGRFSEAVGACDRALSLDPQNVEALVNRGAALSAGGRTSEGIETLRRAGAIETADPREQNVIGMALSNLLLALHYDERDPREMFEEHVRVGRRYDAGRRTFPPHARDGAGARIRVGYLSPDFRLHAVAHFIEPVLAAHDRSRFEVFCYSDSTAADDVTRRLRGYDVRWRDVAGLSHDAAADAVARDGIDVLVDLAGHTGAFRIPLLAMKPAPVQVSYLGYPDTSGLRAMDYRVTDAIADPPGMTEPYHVERLVRLRTAWCYRPLDTAPPVGPLPSSLAGHVTFGSFNNAQKLTRPMLELWARIVAKVPGAKVLIKAKGLDNPSHRQRVSDSLLCAGIPAGRFELLGRVPSMEAHLDLYNRVDLALDTYPYNGTTTTCEALWMGVPVVTLTGKTHASRVGASLLKTIGFGELVADSAEAYAAAAVALAGDDERRAVLRAGMRRRVSGSPLMDAGAFTRELEDAYVTMVERARAAAQAD